MPLLGYKPTEEHKRKISEILIKKGIKPPSRKGIKHTEITKQKMSKNNAQWNLGKHWKLSETTKKKMSKTHKRIGTKPPSPILGSHHSEETKRKIKENNARYWKGKTGKNNPNWQGGKSFEKYTVDWTETLKRSIRERDKYTCQICGKEPSVYCHHIDYNKKNCSPNNLVTLCRKCHLKTNYNRNDWIDYFITPTK